MGMQAVISNMDGVIADFETLWRQAQADTLVQWGATASVDECETLTKSKRLDEIAGTWCRYFQFDPDPQWLGAVVLQRTTGLVAIEGELMHGVHEVLHYFHEAGYQIALAMLLSCQAIAAVLNKLSLWHSFDAVSSVDDEPRGKPYPAVYPTAPCKLNLNASQYLVIEDSHNDFRTVQVAGIPMMVVVEDNRQERHQATAGRYQTLLELLEASSAEPTAVAQLMLSQAQKILGCTRSVTLFSVLMPFLPHADPPHTSLIFYENSHVLLYQCPNSWPYLTVFVRGIAT